MTATAAAVGPRPEPGGPVTSTTDGPDLLSDPAVLFYPVTHRDAVGEVTDRLMAAVALGLYLPGERLPTERALAATLGVPRTTVRDSLARLRADGVVETRRGRTGGAYVRADWSDRSPDAIRNALRPDDEELAALFDMRELVEGMIARAAARRRTPDDVAAITRALAAFLAATTPSEHHRADIALHAAVLLAAHNSQLVALTTDLLARITPGIAIEPYSPDMDARASVEHRELVEAVVAGDAERAGTIAEHHFQITSENTRRVVARGHADTGYADTGGHLADLGDVPGADPGEATPRVA